jgi:hypothetical protein
MVSLLPTAPRPVLTAATSCTSQLSLTSTACAACHQVGASTATYDCGPCAKVAPEAASKLPAAAAAALAHGHYFAVLTLSLQIAQLATSLMVWQALRGGAGKTLSIHQASVIALTPSRYVTTSIVCRN